MENFDKRFDEFLDSVDKFMEECPDEEVSYVAVTTCREIINNASRNHIEELGFVELIKDDLKKFFEFCYEEDKKEAEIKKKSPIKGN